MEWFLVMTNRVWRFWSDERGLSAIEFAFVAPIMVTLLLGGFETSQALQVHRKATNVAATAADLASQTTSLTNANMSDVFNASAAIMAPFPTANLTIIVSSITNSSGTLALAWSDGFHTQPRTTVPTVPAGLVPVGTSVILTETTYTYTSPVGQFFTSGINMSDQFYARPRRSLAVGRTP